MVEQFQKVIEKAAIGSSGIDAKRMDSLIKFAESLGIPKYYAEDPLQSSWKRKNSNSVSTTEEVTSEINGNCFEKYFRY